MKSVTTGIATVLVLAACAHAEPDAATKANLAWQIALDRVGFSPGLIDGKIGPKTQLATREFQRARGLPVTGQADAATADALQIDPAKALTTYTIRPQDDLEIGPAPKTWPEKSRLQRLAYESLAALVGERFHCSQNCLAALNPGRNLAALKAGDTLTVPNAAADGPIARGARVEISFSEKVVRVKDDANRLVGLFPCSIAADKANLPTVRGTSVIGIIPNPTYLFDPKMWPEVKGVDRELKIPPGPRNPVGLVWMGLALKGYGMHGTPAPDMIGKTGSHGCFRLTNWDAVRLSKMIAVGAPVAFSSAPGEAAGPRTPVPPPEAAPGGSVAAGTAARAPRTVSSAAPPARPGRAGFD